MRLPLPLQIALTLAALAAGSGGAAAQSLFETLFGGGAQPAYPSPAQLPRATAPPRLGTTSPPRPRDDDDENHGSQSGAGGQRTVCVRLCDGYYWPISNSTSRASYYRDANQCSSACNGEAKLFHYPANGEIKDAVDLTGRNYTSLANAFKYRKELVAGCSCKPAPWSQAEIERHQVYAADAAASKARPGRTTAGPDGGKTASTTSAERQPAAAMTSDAAEPTRAEHGDEVVPAAGTKTNSPPRPPTEAQRRPAARSPASSEPPTRRAAAAPAPPRPPAKAVVSTGGFWGGTQTYTWPGDPPPRIR